MKLNRKTIPTALTSLALAGQLCLPTAALAVDRTSYVQGDVTISQAFTDPNLRNWLLNASNLNGAGADGILTEEERQAVTNLDLSGLGLTSLDGLEAFPNLQVLNCSDNALTELDLSANRNLVHLSCSFNRLTQLDLTDMSQLISLNCEMNRLTSLTLTGCSRLSSLYCRNNRLDRLDLSDNRALEFIETFDNLLTEIDVTHLEDLRFLHIDHNRLTHLDMSQNRKLEGGGFVARNNFVETILLPDQPGLTVYLDDYNEQDPIDGFDKVEWYLDAEHTIPAPETLEAAGQTLYSKRIPNRYTVYFSANGGAGSMNKVDAVWNVPFELPEQTFRRYGYTFSHWSALPSEDYKVLQNGEEVSNLAGKKTDGDRITLYAQWSPNRYSILLDPNGGDGEAQTIGAAYGQTVTLPESPFTKERMEFAGWATSTDGPVRYANQAQVWNLTAEAGETVTLYAVWRTPVSELQKPYLETLETAFRTYGDPSDGVYTGEDWDSLSGAYEKAASAIRAAEQEPAMQRALEQGLTAMKGIPTMEERIGEVVSGWERTYAEALEALDVPALTESNAAEKNLLAQAALDGMAQDVLSGFCSLNRQEDKTNVVSAAAQRLQGRSEALLDLQQAASWVSGLDGLTTLPMEQVQPEHLTAYQTALDGYDALDDAVRGAISPSVVLALHDRHELSGEKHSSLLALQTAFESLDKKEYSEKGQAALDQALKNGQAAIRSAASAEQARQAQKTAWETILKIPTANQEPSEPVTPPAGGGGSGGGSVGGGGGGSSVPESPEGNRPVTVTDEKTGASAVVTKAEDGSVQAEVTLPEGVSHATLRIPCEGGAQTVAVMVGADGTRKIIPKSVYQDGALAVRVEQSGRMELIENKKNSSDVQGDEWFASSVQFTASRELFSGIGNDRFAPSGTMTRAMLATVLHRLEGEPEAALSGMFPDVAEESWYGAAVAWAAETGVVSGVGGGLFAPEAPISRESLALMLYRCAGSPAVERGAELDGFADAGKISAWARDAMEWACASGILNGDGAGQLRPQSDCTRAEVSAMLARFVNQII